MALTRIGNSILCLIFVICVGPVALLWAVLSSVLMLVCVFEYAYIGTKFKLGDIVSDSCSNMVDFIADARREFSDD